MLRMMFRSPHRSHCCGQVWLVLLHGGSGTGASDRHEVTLKQVREWLSSTSRTPKGASEAAWNLKFGPGAEKSPAPSKANRALLPYNGSRTSSGVTALSPFANRRIAFATGERMSK